MKAQFPAAFHDITVGSISVPCTLGSSNCIAANPVVAGEGQIGSGTTPWYNAGVGYDLATGLGSVDAAVLVADWGSVNAGNSTTTTLTPSSTSFTHGTAITVSGNVTGTGTPTGNVVLMTDSTEPGQQTQATFSLSSGAFSSNSVSFLPGGTYNIWGQYSGDGANATSTSAKTPITVSPEASTTYFNILNSLSVYSGTAGISSGQTNVPYGTQGLLAAEVYGTNFYNTCVKTSSTAPSCAYYGVPTGTVTFADNGTTINNAALNSEGDAEFNAPFFVGTHSVTASYSGDKSYNSSTASAITFTVVKDTPDVYLAASNLASTSSFIFAGGQATVLNVWLENSGNDSTLSQGAAAVNSAAPPTGSVTVTLSPSVTGSPFTVPLSAGVDPDFLQPDGVGSFVIPAATPAGNYTLTITYAGDSNYAAITGTQASGTITITAPGTGLLTSSVTATMSGSISPTTEVTITGTVQGRAGMRLPPELFYCSPPATAISMS